MLVRLATVGTEAVTGPLHSIAAYPEAAQRVVQPSETVAATAPATEVSAVQPPVVSHAGGGTQPVRWASVPC